MTVLCAAVGGAMTSLFIRKYRTRVLQTSDFEVAHMTEKIELACSAYFERTNPLPSIHCTMETLQLCQRKLTHLLIAVVPGVVLGGDDY